MRLKGMELLVVVVCMGVIVLTFLQRGDPAEGLNDSMHDVSDTVTVQQEIVPESPPSGQEVIDRFYALVAEYNRTVNDEKATWSDETKNRAARIERAHMVSYYTFCCLRYYYLDQLDAGEKTWLFTNLRPDCNLPRSIFCDYPGPIATAPPTKSYGDVRKEFELFIYQSIWEIDYQCQFNIISDEVELADVRQEVRSTMDTLGVPYPKVLHE
ncbi:hypothetical protein KKB10_02085 [Patescibacteria group bacterium]|nr:hypothetical protein [Patescibacteria group bacterium]